MAGMCRIPVAWDVQPVVSGLPLDPWMLQSNIRCTTGESFGLTFVSSLLFADDCIIYTKIVNNTDVVVLQNDLDAL